MPPRRHADYAPLIDDSPLRYTPALLRLRFITLFRRLMRCLFHSLLRCRLLMLPLPRLLRYADTPLRCRLLPAHDFMPCRYAMLLRAAMPYMATPRMRQDLRHTISTRAAAGLRHAITLIFAALSLPPMLRRQPLIAVIRFLMPAATTLLRLFRLRSAAFAALTLYALR